MNQTSDLAQLKYFLDSRVERYNNLDFIESDPIQIPHRFTVKEDIEIAAFLTATISWGQRVSIINNANRLMNWLDDSPFEFITQASEKDWQIVTRFVHRTFNGGDCMYFLQSLKNIYQNRGGLEKVFNTGYQPSESIFEALKYFRNIFLSIPHETRTEKHVSNVSANSSAKRLNMFLRWMVRSDKNEVDFGLWKSILASSLMLPLDVHTGNVARSLELLKRKQNDWKSVEEITAILREFDPTDPIKYDFALFGIGVFEHKK